MTIEPGDKKKVIFLGVLLGGLVLYLIYDNLLSGPSTPSAGSPRATAAVPLPGQGSSERPSSKRAVSANRGRSEEWHPVLHDKRREQSLDPIIVDPTLRLDRLAKLQQVEPAGGTRNLFQFGAKPEEKPKGPEPQIVAWVPIGPKQPPPPAPPPPPKPPPPIPLKFYGISTMLDNGKKTAYFLDGDNEILHAGEGDTVNRRYRVLRIGPTSVLLEDTDSKRQQSLPLAEEAQS